MKYKKEVSKALILFIAVLTAFMPTVSALAQVYNWEFEYPESMDLFEDVMPAEYVSGETFDLPNSEYDPINFIYDIPEPESDFNPTNDPLYVAMPENVQGTPFSYKAPLYDWMKPQISYIDNDVIVMPTEIIEEPVAVEPEMYNPAWLVEPYMYPEERTAIELDSYDDQIFDWVTGPSIDDGYFVDDTIYPWDIYSEELTTESVYEIAEAPFEEVSDYYEERDENGQLIVSDELFKVIDPYNDIATLPNGKKVIRSYSGARILYEEDGVLKIRGDDWREFDQHEESRLSDNYPEGYYYEIPFERENVSVYAGSMERPEYRLEIQPKFHGFERIIQKDRLISNYYNVYPDVDVRFTDGYNNRQREIVINREPEDLNLEEDVIFWEHYSLSEDARVITSGGEALFGEGELVDGVGLYIQFKNGDVFEISGAKVYDSASSDDMHKNISAVGLSEIVRVNREIGELSIGIKIPATYLQDPERVYPVIIDPYYYSCKSSNNDLGCNSVYAELKWDYSRESNDTIMYSGYHLITSHHPGEPLGPAERQIAIWFKNLDFPNNYKVDGAYLNLYYDKPGYNDGKSSYLWARKINKFWDKDNVTHNQLMYSVSSINKLYAYPGMSKDWKSWNVKSAVESWYGNPSSNYGLLISPEPTWTTETNPSWPNSLYGYRSPNHKINSSKPYLQVELTSAGEPDLTIKTGDSSLNKTSFTPGEILKFSTKVTNIGTANSYNKSYIYYYLQKDDYSFSNSYKIGEDSYFNLSPGGSSVESINYTLPSNLLPGTYYLHYWVDATNTVIESNDGNNKFFWKITITDAKPNLTSAKNNVLNKSTYAPGETLTLKHDIWNYGTKNSGTFYVRYYLKKNVDSYDNGYDIGSYIVSISAGSKKTVTQNFTLSNSLTSGKYYISYYIDKDDNKPNGLVIESNENDNTDYTTFNIQAPVGKPDLYISSSGQDFSSRKPGELLTLTTTEKNKGNATSGANYVGYYLSKDTSYSGDDLLIGDVSFSSLSAGSSDKKIKTITIPIDQQPGDYYLIQKADWKDQVNESDEGNNTSWASLKILTKDDPTDLIADSISILVTNVTYVTDKTITMQVKITNTGTNAENNINLKVRLKDKKTGLFYAINNLSQSSVGVSGKYSQTIMLYGSLANTCDLPLSADYEAYLTVDSTKTISETNENNNEVSSGNNTIKIQRLAYCVDKKQDYDGDGAYDADEKFMGTDPMKKDAVPSYSSNFDSYFATPGDYKQDNYGADPVNIRTGALEFKQTDFTLYGLGAPIEFTRTYNSKANERSGRLGNGWSSSYQQYYYQDPDTKRVQLHFGGSLAVLFDTVDGGQTFVAPRSETGKLFWDNGYFVYKTLDGLQYRFGKKLSDRLGMLTEIVDTFGNKLTLGYTDVNEIPLLTTITDASGRNIKLSYGLPDNLVEWDKIKKLEDTFAGPLSRVVNYYYDLNGNLINVSSSRVYNGQTEWSARSFTYVNNRLDTYTDPRGGKLFNVYDGEGRVIEQYEQNPDNEIGAQKHPIYKLSYSGTYLKVPGSQNCTTVKTYTTNLDFFSDISCFDDKKLKIYHENGEGGTEKWVYHENGLPLSYTNENGKTTLFNYDGLKRLQTIIYPDTAEFYNEMHYTYEDKFSQIIKETEKSFDKNTNKLLLERSMSHEVDPKTGLTLSSVDPHGKKESYTYDSYGNKISYTDKMGNKTIYKYDSLGNYLVEQSETAKQPDGGSKIISLKFTYDSHGNKILRTTQRGNVSQFSYDSNGNLRKQIDPYNKTKIYEYDLSGNLTSETDELGRKTTHTYGKGIQEHLLKVEKQSDDGVITQQYDYDVSGRLTKETDPLGRSISYIYDKADRVLSKVFPYYTVNYTYDSTGNLIQENTNAGHKVVYKYDSRNNRIEEQNYLDSNNFVSNKKKYDGFGRVVQETNGNGYSTIKELDLMDRVISTTNPLGGKITNVFDEMGRIIGVIYPRAQSDQSLRNNKGHSISYEYDGLGRLLRQIDADNKATLFFHDEDGKVIKRIERQNTDGSANSRVIQYTYDKLGRVLSETNPAGKTKSFTYDDVGNVLTLKDEAGRIMAFEYDKLDYLVKEKDPTGATAIYKYDKVGNRISSTNSENKTTSFIYDSADRIKTVTDPTGKTQTNSYDIFGMRVSHIDQTGATTNYVYDKLGRITSETNLQGTKTTYTYDKAGRRLSQDIVGKKTTYVFDNFGRLKTTTNPSGAVESFVYDADGNIIEDTDGNGNKISYTLNAINQVVKKTYADGTNNTFVYDNWGGLVSVKDGLGTIDYIYTNKGQRASEKRTFSDLSKSYTTSYTYHPDGKIASVTDPANKKIDYSYDGRGLLKSVAFGGKTLASYTYSPVGNATKVTYGNGVTNNISYNDTQRMDGFAIKNSAGQDLFGRMYSYDERGNTTKIVENGSRTIEYGFDALSQITSEKIINGADVNEFKFTYDKWGNRTALTTPHEQTSYKFESGNDQLTNANYNSRLSVDTTYDKNGNITKETYTRLGNKVRDVSYIWNNRNKLSSIEYTDNSRPLFMPSLPKNELIFVYDFAGNRAKKTSNGKSTYYINRGVAVQNEIDSDGVIIMSLVQGLDKVAQIKKNGSIEYLHQDPVHSTVLSTDENGKVIKEFEYTAFGEIAGMSGDYDYLFTGQEYDFESDLHYYNARYYNPRLGRFLSRDAVRGYDGDLLTKNPYIYVKNNPLKYVDPTGNEKENAGGMSYSSAPAPGQMSFASDKAFSDFLSTLSDNELLDYSSGISAGAGMATQVRVPYINLPGYTWSMRPHPKWSKKDSSILNIYNKNLNPRKGIRLDSAHKYKNYMHWNQRGVSSKFGGISDSTRVGFGTKAIGYGFKTLKIIGKPLIVLGIIADGYSIYTAEDRVGEAISVAGGWGGAYGGAYGGALLAGALCSFTGPGALLCAGAGAVVGGIGGYFAGEQFADLIYEKKDAIVDTAVQTYGYVKDAVVEAATDIYDISSEIGGYIADTASDIGDYVSNAASSVKSYAVKAKNTVVNTISNAVDTVSNAASNAWSSTKDFFSGLW